MPEETRPGMLPPAFSLLAIIAMAVLHQVMPLAQVVSGEWRYTGTLPVVLGLVLNVWAAAGFRQHDTPIRPFETCRLLVRQGPYRFSRNPMYLGILLVLAGIALLLGSLSSFLVVLVMCWLLHTQFVLREESMLQELFREEYQEYRRKVRRWF